MREAPNRPLFVLAALLALGIAAAYDNLIVASGQPSGFCSRNLSTTHVDEVASAGTRTHDVDADTSGFDASAVYLIGRVEVIASYDPTPSHRRPPGQARRSGLRGGRATRRSVRGRSDPRAPTGAA